MLRTRFPRLTFVALLALLSGCAEEIAGPTKATPLPASRSSDLLGISIPSPFYAAYAAYFAFIGSGATERFLPSSVIQKLEPYFVNDVLSAVRYASSEHTNHKAITDCYKIYFPKGYGVVSTIQNGEIFEDWAKDDLHWLLHELAHAEQCRAEGGRSDFADRWFSELGTTTAAKLVTDPRSISAETIHDAMPMEQDAEAKADRVLRLIWGLQYSDHAVGSWTRLRNTARTTGEVMIADFGTNACDQGLRRDDVFLTQNGQWFVSWCGTTSWMPLKTSSTEIGDKYGLALGDFNGDGIADVFRASDGEWKVSYSGTSAWTKIKSSTTEMTDTYGLAFGDFNGDGRTDVFRASGGEWKVSFSGSGPWTTIKQSTTELKDSYGLAFGDFNGDGITDVFRASGGEWKVSYSGTSAWTTLRSSTTELLDQHGLILGYFDDDKTVDVLRANGTEWLYSAGGTKPWVTLKLSKITSRRLIVGDLTGDGRSEVVLAREPLDCVTVFGNFCSWVYYFNNSAPTRH